MKTVCKLNECAGCMACVEICPQNAISIQDKLISYNAVIDETKCVKCNSCYNVCQSNHPIEGTKPIVWYQGWAKDKFIREKSSSGGYATAIALSFQKMGGIVYGCNFDGEKIKFIRGNSEKSIFSLTGSKYVKSNPYGIYKQIKRDILNKEKVLFIGLPCQVAAVRNYVGKMNIDNLYTIDLICHGTPSPNLLEFFLNQYNKSLYSAKEISFRVKNKMQLHLDNKGIVEKGVSDKYTIAFLNGLTYTENCYNCSYASLNRVSDLTLGDSWGTNIDEKEQKKGISLAICQTTKGVELLNNSNLKLLEVDLEKAIINNRQLSKPSIRPRNRINFYKKLNNKHSFNKLIFMAYPKICLKQDVKELLIKLKIIK